MDFGCWKAWMVCGQLVREGESEKRLNGVLDRLVAPAIITTPERRAIAAKGITPIEQIGG